MYITGLAASAAAVIQKAGLEAQPAETSAFSRIMELARNQQVGAADPGAYKQTMLQLTEQMRRENTMFLLRLLSGNKAEESEEERRRRCMQIAARIMNGEHVSDEDLRYLMQNDPGLYFQAIMMQQLNADMDILKFK